jgi:hypothetical protein
MEIHVQMVLYVRMYLEATHVNVPVAVPVIHIVMDA